VTNAQATPQHAATVVVIRARAGTSEPELFMVKRHPKSGFMASAFVYPGGKLDEEDSGADLLAMTAGMTAEDALARFGPGNDAGDDAPLTGQEALGVHVAAARELFEEAGILLAEGIEASEETLDAWRAELESGLAFGSLLQREGLILRPDHLLYFAHWITPIIEARRYNTRFFLAAAPPGQEGYHDKRETVDSAWVTPSEALHRYAASDIQLAPPTLRTLEDMAAFGSVDALLTGMVPASVPAILPRFENIDDAMVLLMPGDPLYPSAKPVEGPTRVALREGRWWSETAP
jgi:8-oxo-dGTP pyrophosphatase MutT (NUDIX family)